MTRWKRVLAALATALLLLPAVPAAALEGELVVLEEGLAYQQIGRFSEGLAPVLQDGRWGYIDTNGTLLLPAIYESEQAHPFSEGLAYVDSIGFIDWSGEVVLTGDFASALSFSEGLAAVCYTGADGRALWGYVDRTGAPATEAQYVKAGRFCGGMAFVVPEEGRGHFIDRGLARFSAEIFEDSLGFHEGLAAVKQDGLWGFLNAEGGMAIPAQFDTAESFSDGLALVSTGADRFYIDTSGRRVLDASQYDSCGSFSEGMAPVCRDGRYGMVDSGGELVIALEYDAINDFNESYAALQKNGVWELWGKAPFFEIPSIWAVGQVNTAIHVGIVPQALQADYAQATTRAEFCALALCLYETVKGAEPVEARPFADTDDPAIAKMAALGVVEGVGDNSFAPDQPLTREQAAAMLARLAEAIGTPLPQQEATFADLDSVSDWAQAAVGQVQQAGVMSGLGDNSFDPKGTYTREQSIVAMLRLYAVVTG